MVGMILNSLWLVGGGTLFSVAASTMMAYAMTKYEFVGRKVLYGIQIFILTVPIIGSLGSQMRLYTSFGMIDSPTILFAYTGGFGAMNLYISACFRGISDTYAEAAKMDGAGHYTIMFQIMLPLAKGIIIAMAVMQAISIWNDSQTALLFLRNMPTLATGIYLFESRASQGAMFNIMLAATVLSTLPPLLLYSFTHKIMMESVYMGGIKG
jgi:ABC-type glycerol-3-phosphate transport system permease component